MPHPAPKLFTTGSWYVGSSEFTGCGPALCQVAAAPATRALAWSTVDASFTAAGNAPAGIRFAGAERCP